MSNQSSHPVIDPDDAIPGVPNQVPDATEEISYTLSPTSEETFREIPRIEQPTRITRIRRIVPHVAIQDTIARVELHRLLPDEPPRLRIIFPATVAIEI